MNNVTCLHTIYINFQQRAVFDGTLEGLRTKLAQFGINTSDLENRVMMGDEVEKDVADYLFDMDEMTCFVTEDDIQGIDEMGIYLDIPEFKEASWGIQPELRFYGDDAQRCIDKVVYEMGLTA
jgi:hypothetical protein